MSLRTSESIAGAVAREIDRIDRTGETHGEGAAYKAAWDRKGSSCFKHCDAFTADCDKSLAVANVGKLPLRSWFSRPSWRITPSVFGVVA